MRTPACWSGWFFNVNFRLLCYRRRIAMQHRFFIVSIHNLHVFATAYIIDRARQADKRKRTERQTRRDLASKGQGSSTDSAIQSLRRLRYSTNLRRAANLGLICQRQFPFDTKPTVACTTDCVWSTIFSATTYEQNAARTIANTIKLPFDFYALPTWRPLSRNILSPPEIK